MSLVIGSTVDGYQILDYFDSSRKRISYRARNLNAHRIERLQILPDNLRQDPERAARFERESRILANLKHPNILTFHGTVEVGGHLALSMEALEAVTLADRLEVGPMEVEDAARTILQVLAAADAAHAAGVVHREISPANIYITPEGLVKLVGFSVAKAIGDANLTRAGTLVGDVVYTAPEIFEGKTAIDPRSDLYSIGCVFYALVTGRPPFLAASEYEVMVAHVQHPPAAPSQLNPNLNQRLDAVILRALGKTPSSRYSSAREFYNGILDPAGVPEPPLAAAVVEPPPPAPPPLINPPESLRLVPALVAAGFGALVLIAAFFMLAASRSLPTP